MSDTAIDLTTQPQARPLVHVRETREPYVVVGAGPVGVRLVKELLQRDPDAHVLLFGAEPWMPYDRVQLSALLAGQHDDRSLWIARELQDDPRVEMFHNLPVIAIDRRARVVIDARHQPHAYHRLVLATGSRPHVPQIPGTGLRNVFTFRDLADAERLKSRLTRSRHTLVIGGGLLGLEAAGAMRRFRTEVSVLEHNARLMFNRLDEAGAGILRRYVESLGIRVHTGEAVQEICGSAEVTGVLLRNGKHLDCDTVIIATGINPNVDLARSAGLQVHRGVCVDDAMRSSDPDIFAAGECAEHRETVYGLIAPGIEQAAVAAHNITGGRAVYAGSLAAAQLKVIGLPVFSTGQPANASWTDARYRYEGGDGVYRALVTQRGRLQGAIAVGAWPQVARVEEAVQARRRLWPWQLWRFQRGGELWRAADEVGVADWPGTVTVCRCTGVTRAQLGQAVEQGAATLQALAARTGASSVCGSCRPLLAQLVGSLTLEPVRGFLALATVSAAALALLILAYGLPALPYNDTVQTAFRWDLLWRDSLAKQISGFTLLGLSVLAVVLSLRKRTRWLAFGQFHKWRIVHAVLGALTIAVLAAHTGWRVGANLNLALMLVFIAIVLAGTLAALPIALEHKLSPRSARRLRSLATWTHILASWPLPALLGVHIAKTYYF